MFKEIEPQPNIPKLEEEILKFWQENHIFKKSLEKNQGKDRFVFFEGPPTANGRPGLHHMEARAFKDIILRFQTMRGKYVLRKAGWDTHGLPVELEVEKSLGISGKRQIENLVRGDKRASIEKFNKLCRESVWKYKDEWERFTARMGFWIDLEHPYITYENSYIESVWWALQQISKRSVHGKPLLYEGHKVLPYCPRCGTALSSHEVAQGYQEVEETSVYVRFLLKDKQLKIKGKRGRPEVIALDRPTYLLSWTTTPWTLPGNVALAVGENIEYALVLVQDQQYLVASALLEKVFGSEYKVIITLRGTSLVGLSYEPLFAVKELSSDASYRVYAADFVTTDEGTGIVHTAVMYGEDDYELGSAVGLPKFHTVNEEGFFVGSVDGLAGAYVKDPDTDRQILKLLKKGDALLKTLPYRHDYPFCWRCGTALLYYARNSWFIRMSSLVSQLQKNNEQITWVPEYIKHGRFGEWLSEVKDWAISRERYWGTPLPFWKCINPQCGSVEVLGSREELERRSGQVLPENFDLHRPFIDELKFSCSACAGGSMNRVPEVLDVWFDSGAMPYAQWHYPFENEKIFAEQLPANYIAEAIDQTRGWFYTLLAVATALGEDRPPYRSVICLGHVLDQQGQKMSKSKGNVVEPMQLMDKYGADIVRWHMFSLNQPGDPKRFTEAEVTRLQRQVQLMAWNIQKYFTTYANAHSWQYTDQSLEDARSSLNILDRWIMTRFNQTGLQVSRRLERLDVFRAARAVEGLVDDLSTWYLRRSRGRTERSFFATFFHALLTLSKLLAPFMPFFSEVMYRHLRPEQFAVSVHVADWPVFSELTAAEELFLGEMQEVRSIVETVLGWRKREGIRVRQPLPDLYVKSANLDLHNFTFLLREELNFVNIHIGEEIPNVERLVRLAAVRGKHPEVYINRELSAELRSQGLAREIERHVQDLRKRSGLQIGQRVLLFYETRSQEFYEAFEYFDQHKTYTARVVGARQQADYETILTIAGQTLWIGLKRFNQ